MKTGNTLRVPSKKRFMENRLHKRWWQMTDSFHKILNMVHLRINIEKVCKTSITWVQLAWPQISLIGYHWMTY